jgi:hypothetical protein
MRGSLHDKGIREFTIDEAGMHIGDRFRNVTGILAGNPMHLSPADLERTWLDHDSSVARRQSKHDKERRGTERRRS